MRINHHPGFVLHLRPYSETSLLIDVFCREYGRFMLIAKGARRQKTGLRGVLMPFSPLLLSWSGKGQLPVLTSAESQKYTATLKGNALHSGYYINELILKFLHRFDEHIDLYDAYDSAIHQLVLGSDPSTVLRIFEKRLLREIGFGLILDHDIATGESVQDQLEYHYLPERGPVACETETGESLAQGYRISGKTLQALQSGEFDAASAKQARRLTRHLIQHQLGNKSMRSRRVMMELLKYRSSISVS